MKIRELWHPDKESALDVLCAAFHDYPVTRYVVGADDPDYDSKLRELAGFFVEARLMRGVPLIGLCDGSTLIGVAVLTPPGESPAPPALDECHARVSRRLGAEAMARFERYDEACEATDPGHFAHYLGMIGVRPEVQGHGLGRQLMDAVKQRAQSHPRSTGVALNTESEENLQFYARMGFQRISEADAESVHTWSFYWRCR